MESIIDVIKKRNSVRNYSSNPIEKNKVQQIEAYLKNNTQGPLGSKVRFKFFDAVDYEPAELKKFGTYGFIKGARAYIAGVVMSNVTAMEDFGYCMEKNVLFATGLGLGTCWLGGTLNRSTFAQMMNVTEDEVLPAVTPIGYAEERKTLMESVIRLAAGADGRKKTEELFFDNSNSIPLVINSVGQYAKVLDAVRIAPSASNKQPWRIIKGVGNKYHFYMKEDAAYNTAFKNIKIQNMDMGIAMCHFELAAIELGLKGVWKIEKPAIETGELKYIVSWVG